MQRSFKGHPIQLARSARSHIRTTPNGQRPNHHRSGRPRPCRRKDETRHARGGLRMHTDQAQGRRSRPGCAERTRRRQHSTRPSLSGRYIFCTVRVGRNSSRAADGAVRSRRPASEPRWARRAFGGRSVSRTNGRAAQQDAPRAAWRGRGFSRARASADATPGGGSVGVVVEVWNPLRTRGATDGARLADLVARTGGGRWRWPSAGGPFGSGVIQSQKGSVKRRIND